MKSVLITFDQAYFERIIALLDRLSCRGFTYLERRQAIPTSAAMPGPVCVRPSSRWWTTRRLTRCWMHCIRWTCRQSSLA